MATTKAASTEAVKVMVRVRPMNKKEMAQGCKPVIKVYKEQNIVELSRPGADKGPCKDFTYDSVYDTDA